MCGQSSLTLPFDEQLSLTTLHQVDDGVSRPPRAEDICALFAGVQLLVSALRKWWSGYDKSLRCLAAIDDSHISDLSEIGRRLRKDQRQHRHAPVLPLYFAGR